MPSDGIVKPYLVDRERVHEYYTSSNWVWICTDQRVLKYKEGEGKAEEFHDISLEEISGISYVNSGREDWLIIGAFILVIFLVAIPVFSGTLSNFLPLAIAILAGVVALVYAWRGSESVYFVLRGDGLIQLEEDKWKINHSGGGDHDDAVEFVNAIRESL